MTPDQIFEEMKGQVTRASRARVFAGGLLPAFCNFFLGLDQPEQGYTNLQDFYAKHPQVTQNVNTLTVLPDNKGRKVRTIRQPYEQVAKFYVVENNRITFPSAAPHATGQWRDYQHWIETLVTLSPEQLIALADRAKAFMLSWLPESTFDPSTVVIEKPIFHILLDRFPLDERQGKEKTGAAFQAMVFAFIRADAPHLQVETRRVRTGSARVQGIGDVDAWEGKKLTISAEVKHFNFSSGDLDDIKKFIDNVRRRGALGLVVATSFEEGVEEMIKDEGLQPLTLVDLKRIVSLWDPVKQRAALNAFEWAVVQKELSLELGDRLDKFLVAEGFRSSPISPISSGKNNKKVIGPQT